MRFLPIATRRPALPNAAYDRPDPTLPRVHRIELRPDKASPAMARAAAINVPSLLPAPTPADDLIPLPSCSFGHKISSNRYLRAQSSLSMLPTSATSRAVSMVRSEGSLVPNAVGLTTTRLLAACDDPVVADDDNSEASERRPIAGALSSALPAWLAETPGGSRGNIPSCTEKSSSPSSMRLSPSHLDPGGLTRTRTETFRQGSKDH